MFLTAGETFIVFPCWQHTSWRLPVKEHWYRHLHILHTAGEITAYSLTPCSPRPQLLPTEQLVWSPWTCLDPSAEPANTHHQRHFWQSKQSEGQPLASTQPGLKLSLLMIHVAQVFKLIWHMKLLHTSCYVLQTNIQKSFWALMTPA